MLVHVKTLMKREGFFMWEHPTEVNGGWKEEKRYTMTKVEEARKEVCEKVLALMEQGGLRWKKEWADFMPTELPYNGVTGRKYNGGNIMLLAYAGFEDARWYSKKQIEELGYSIKEGEQPHGAEFWKPVTKVFMEGEWQTIKKSMEIPEGALKRTFWNPVALHSVWNAEQLLDKEGNELVKVEKPKGELHDIADTLKASSRVPITERGDRAFYNVGLDKIQLPPRKTFSSMKAFISTMAHEMTHSTCKPLKRNVGSGKFGSKSYAYEELVAELGAMFVCIELGIEETDIEHDENAKNSAAYLAGWMEKMKKDPDYLFSAAALAAKACDYIISRYEAEKERGERKAA